MHPIHITNAHRHSANHEAAHFVASVKYGIYTREVRILPESGRPIKAPGYSGKCTGYVISYADLQYDDSLIDLAGPAMDAVMILSGDLAADLPTSCADYDSARERFTKESEFFRCLEDAGAFVYSHRELIERVGDRLLAAANKSGRIGKRDLAKIATYIKSELARPGSKYSQQLAWLSEHTRDPLVAAYRERLRMQYSGTAGYM